MGQARRAAAPALSERDAGRQSGGEAKRWWGWEGRGGPRGGGSSRRSLRRSWDAGRLAAAETGSGGEAMRRRKMEEARAEKTRERAGRGAELYRPSCMPHVSPGPPARPRDECVEREGEGWGVDGSRMTSSGALALTRGKSRPSSHGGAAARLPSAHGPSTSARRDARRRARILPCGGDLPHPPRNANLQDLRSCRDAGWRRGHAGPA
jgi:hypothetical protein